jgi:adenylyltransferase/sulfurtransferase
MGVVVIGLGGVGSALVEPLARYLNYNGGPKELVLIDGDSYERRNLERQRAGTEDLAQNKARVHSERLKKNFKSLSVAWHEDFVTQDNVASLVKSGDVVLACVDNHATRKLLQDYCQRLREVILISGGNEFFDGNVLVYVKRNGRQLTPPIHKYHPEIAFPEDKSPDQLSCEELEAAGNEQLLFTNLTVAVLMLNAFYGLSQAKAKYSEVYFDIRNNSFRAFERR